MRVWMGVMALVALCLAAGRADAVINGRPADTSAFAGSSVIVTHGAGFCTATKIAPRLVLTAAHCVVRMSMALLTVNGAVKSAPIPVVKAIVNPRYRASEWANRRVTADLAILKVASPLPGSIASLTAGGATAAGERATIVGFGPLQEGDTRSMGLLRSADLVVTGRPGSLQVRLSGQGQGGCVGDSGGPAFRDEAGSPVLFGVISWTTGPNGRACGGLTGLVPLDPHRDWIAATMRGEGP